MIALRTSLRFLILGLGVAIVLELAFHLAVAPNLRMTKLVFSGDRPRLDGVSPSSLLGLRDREYYFSVDENAVEQRLDSLAWVKNAIVKKKFPDTLLVNLAVRKPLALSLVGGAVLVIDDTGLVIDVRTDAKGLDLPVISGVTFEALRSGSRFPDQVMPLFSRLASLQKDAPQLYQQISEVQLKPNDRGSFDSVLYPSGAPVRILLGDRWDLGTIQQMFVLLDVIGKQGWQSKTKEIDFRATPVVLRSRES